MTNPNYPDTTRFAAFMAAVHQAARELSLDTPNRGPSGNSPADWHWLLAQLSTQVLFHGQEAAYFASLIKPDDALQVNAVIAAQARRHQAQAELFCVRAALALSGWHAHSAGYIVPSHGMDASAMTTLSGHREVAT